MTRSKSVAPKPQRKKSVKKSTVLPTPQRTSNADDFGLDSEAIADIFGGQSPKENATFSDLFGESPQQEDENSDIF